MLIRIILIVLIRLKIAEIIAKKQNAYSDGENVIKPSIVNAVEILFGEKEAKVADKIPLSRETIGRRVNVISSDLKEQLKTKVAGKKFSIQLDETTDIGSKAQLLIFIKFQTDDTILEEYLACIDLLTTTRGTDIFQSVKLVFDDFGLLWENLVQICTDGAPAMTGRLIGFTSLVKQRYPHVISSHCVIHREQLMAKSLPSELDDVLKTVISVVNFIKSSPLKSRIFELLCQEMGSEYLVLLYHTEVRWLSRGNVLKRFFTLLDEVIAFLKKNWRNKI